MDDDDCSENVCKKICVLSNLLRVYLDPLNDMSKAGDFSLSWILKDFIQFQKEEGSRMSTSSIKRQIRRFYVVVVQWTSEKCTNKGDARAALLFWSLNLLFFFFDVFVVVVVVAYKLPFLCSETTRKRLQRRLCWIKSPALKDRR